RPQLPDLATLSVRKANSSHMRRKAANILRSLVTSIEVIPREGRGELELSVHGPLAELLDEIYAGRRVWNRVRMVKDPDTGRRVSRPNPESEWLTTDVPHLRIIDQETFDAARKRKMERSHEAPAKRQRPRHLLSGLLKCGACGSGMRVHDKDRGR